MLTVMDRHGSKQRLAAAMCKIALLYITSAGVPVFKTLILSAGVQQETLLLTAADVNVWHSRCLRLFWWWMKLQWIQYPVWMCTVSIACILAV